MISIEEALSVILKRTRVLESESLTLEDCLGRVLVEQATAKEDVPPFTNSAMDGYAVRAEDTRTASPEAPVSLVVLEDLPAGRVTEQEVGEGETIRIMTGAPLPPGADAVVKVEDTESVETGSGGAETVRILRAVVKEENVRRAGESVERGEVVLVGGTVLRHPEIGMLAALGYPRVRVIPPPRVAIISTGDELQGIDEPLKPGRILDCNRYSLTAAVEEYSGVPIPLGIVADREGELQAKLEEALSCDMVLTSGGVSVGKYDLVRKVLREMGGELLIKQVSMKPGKPLTFTVIDDRPIFSLPGNPVSVLVSFLMFVRPALLKMQGRKIFRKPEVEAILAEDLDERTDRTHLVRGHAIRDGKDYRVRPTGPQGSGILRSLILGNALMVIPPGQGPLRAGEKVRVILTDMAEID